ncbi:uncharacterized protein EDB91DRAFT_85937 [Suillus paluster]|uniref:uncharacterized protein n=1 Tax=Suillus paluster TaxID=48578 RepID=UPI001B8827F1|nr:uncharacterized protein EDB91DRAFT_85937 [Suillus paluster]KAG1725629.1 hypothetical protein EDB91DRAFT_85937 [Suillus paluster]
MFVRRFSSCFPYYTQVPFPSFLVFFPCALLPWFWFMVYDLPPPPPHRLSYVLYLTAGSLYYLLRIFLILLFCPSATRTCTLTNYLHDYLFNVQWIFVLFDVDWLFQ